MQRIGRLWNPVLCSVKLLRQRWEERLGDFGPRDSKWHSQCGGRHRRNTLREVGSGWIGYENQGPCCPMVTLRMSDPVAVRIGRAVTSSACGVSLADRERLQVGFTTGITLMSPDIYQNATGHVAESCNNTIQSRKSPVRVLFSLLQPDLGGIARDVANLILYIDRERFAPYLVCYNNTGIWLDQLLSVGVPILHLPVESIRSRAAVAAACELHRFLRRHRIEIVHAWDSTAALSVPVARLAGVPVVLSSVVASRNLLDKRTHQLFRMTDHLVHGIVVNCEAMRRHVIVDEGVPEDKVELYQNGIEVARFYPGSGRTCPRMSKLVIGTACALRPEKALNLLQEAFAKVRELRPELTLLIVGGGPELAALQQNARTLGIDRDSIFAPATLDVPSFLRQIDIFVVCSRSEALPNALLEAMACGCSCVGSRTGSIPELLGNSGERGLLFNCGEPMDLARMLERLVVDDSLRRELGTKGSAYVRSAWTMDKSVEQMCQIYSRYLGRRK